MPIVIKIKGNLVDAYLRGEIDSIAHGCNCVCSFGAGIAAEIAQKIPKAYEADLETKDMTVYQKIGTMSVYKQLDRHAKKRVFNLYTQMFPGRAAPGHDIPLSYEALRLCFRQLNELAKVEKFNLGINKIGAGLAGGDWELIQKIINEETPDIPIAYYEFVPPELQINRRVCISEQKSDIELHDFGSRGSNGVTFLPPLV